MNVLIIGGSSDIGINLAKFLVNNNYNVISTYHKNEFKLDKVDTLECDVRDEKEIENTIKYVINKYGKIDILINMSAIYMDNSFLNKTKNEFMNVLEVNLVGTFLCNQIYSRYIDDGMIVNISSTDGIDTYNEYNIDYSASKAGVINISQSISRCTNNKVLCICPNWIDSDSTRSMNKEYLDSELKRVGQDRLITISELISGIYKIINMNCKSGSIYRIDIREGKLWIEEI